MNFGKARQGTRHGRQVKKELVDEVGKGGGRGEGLAGVTRCLEKKREVRWSRHLNFCFPV